ncbi:MAG: glutamine--fructose-6-phosphate transaminase (isomerizing) [Candidatus Micrarchaeota archaeon]
MCGIIGYVGFRQASPLLINGLKKLDYRGYDSAGLAVFENVLVIKKQTGFVDALGDCNFPGTVGIAHTRWATHGCVSQANAHPHSSGKIVIVHNGIISNYAFLKKKLVGEGFVFSSETDSEVIAHLIDSKAGSLLEAVKQTVSELEGSFAFLAFSQSEPNVVVGARKDSPLIVGVNEGECFLASDATPLAGLVEKVFYLNDCEIVVAGKGTTSFYDFSGKELKTEPVFLSLSEESVSLNGYSHFMLKEILEQPASIRRTLMQDEEKLKEISNLIKNSESVFLVACGTSFHSCLFAKKLFFEAGKHVEVVLGSEFDFIAEKITENALVIGVSQSGETADVLMPLKKAKAGGARILALVNVVGSSLARLADASLYFNCGPELSVASTKVFSSQLALFYLLVGSMKNEFVEARSDLEETSFLIEENIDYWNEETKCLAGLIYEKSDVYFIGRGLNYPIALEGALKLKEVSYAHAEGMPAGELKHGTLALVSSGTPVVLLNVQDDSFIDSLANGLETKARGAFLIGLSEVESEDYDFFIKLPETKKNLKPLLEILPLQLLAFHSAVLRGCNPDKPRNLAKSCTVK